MPRIQLELDQVKQLPTTYSAVIPADYMDEMGHMNVMWYTHLFSMAMGGLFEMIGLTEETMLEQHGGSFALECHIRYLSEVRVGHAIHVHTRLLNRSQKRYHVLHSMVNERKQDVAATFEVIGAYIDMRTRRMAQFPDAIATQLDRIIAQHQALTWTAPVCGILLP